MFFYKENRGFEFACSHLFCLVLPAGGEITVTAALLHVMSPHQVDLLVTVATHAFVSLSEQGTTIQNRMFIFKE